MAGIRTYFESLNARSDVKRIDLTLTNQGTVNLHRPFSITLGDDDCLGYPDDEPLHPLAEIRLRAERIIIYESNFVAIVQPDRSFEVCRMD